jgi:hypothetical protein
MAVVVELTEGWTGDLDFWLATGAGPYALQGGDLVSLILKTQDGRPVDTVGNVSIVPPGSDGRVRYSPDAGDLLAKNSPYLARWKLTTGGRVVFFPNGREMAWLVRA